MLCISVCNFILFAELLYESCILVAFIFMFLLVFLYDPKIIKILLLLIYCSFFNHRLLSYLSYDFKSFTAPVVKDWHVYIHTYVDLGYKLVNVCSGKSVSNLPKA